MVCDHNKLLEPKKKKKKKFTHGLKFKEEQCMLANLFKKSNFFTV